VNAQQQCYFGPGASSRAGSDVVPCQSSGQSACCLLGDTCLSGNTCYNNAAGNVYQYGYVSGVNGTWVCHAPESCGCNWPYSVGMLQLVPRGCQEMGDMARVALFAPSVIPPYVSLPSSRGGSTGYYSTTSAADLSTTWVSTAIDGYTPTPIVPLTQYTNSPTVIVQVQALKTTYTSDYASSPSNAPAPGTLTSAQSTSPIQSSSSTQPAPPTQSATSGALSSGAKAGIGVGASVGGLALVATGLFMFLRRRPQRKEK
ncbi:hypothetical protein K461DRAFT_215690, partial [Myriangium duriaei CBS 260.36]